tara:strand:+ start:144 stop:290 length:147 start_codon:yes stop_codon:yes gene_type:complete
VERFDWKNLKPSMHLKHHEVVNESTQLMMIACNLLSEYASVNALPLDS